MADFKNDNKQQTFNVLAPDAKKLSEQTKDGSKHDPLTQANLSHDWYTALGIFPPRFGVKVEPLICGEVAFKAIHKAIEAATKTVDIIIWGFDPCMRFNPNETDMTIGELIEKKGQQGVKCRILVWQNPLGKHFEPTLIGANYNTDATLSWAEQAKLQDNKWRLNSALKAAELPDGTVIGTPPFTQKINKQALEEDIASRESDLTGYASGSDGGGGPVQVPEDRVKARQWMKRVFTQNMKNVELRTRDFDEATDLQTKAKVKKALLANYHETDTNLIMRLALDKFASHHQKLVIIDYESPLSSTCTGFVMGHNMHRHYWDTEHHYYYEEDANRVPGFGPWQDISTQVWGPVLYDLNKNFAKAWDRVQQALKLPAFKHQLEEQRQSIQPDDFLCDVSYGMQCQFCRTQPEEDGAIDGDYDRSILATYHKAIDNAHNYLYMENQYFRYSDFARRIKKRAVALSDARAEQGKDSPPLYLFVLTNIPDIKVGISTYAMMKELGQQQLMPKAQKDLYEKEQRKAYIKANPGLSKAKTKDYQIDETAMSKKDQEHIEPFVYGDEKIEDLATEDKGYDIEGKNGKKPFELDQMEESNVLKVIVGTLTCDSSVQYNNPHQNQASKQYKIDPTYHTKKMVRYRDIYIHSKLLVVDDIFSFIGSTNINTRSFWVDSETGISIPDTDFAYTMRSKLWQLHAGQSLDSTSSNYSKTIRCDTKNNYDYWSEIMDDNWKNKARGEPLKHHLTRFWAQETPYLVAAD